MVAVTGRPAPVDVLIVDDDSALGTVLSAGLEARDYSVEVRTNGTDALDALDVHDPQVIILDLGLPDLDGLEVCRHMRARTRTPIVVLSADGAEDRKVAALDLGADDYLTKPFSMPELLARIRVALRHRTALAAVVEDEALVFGVLRIDRSAHEAMVDGERLDLSPKEYALLVALARNGGKLLTHRRLIELVWGSDAGLDTLRTHMSALRRKLARHADAGLRIVTEPGVGYRLLLDTDASS
jgi:two-component system KDP operon response regulator KdpE